MKGSIKPFTCQSGNERGVVWERLQSDKSLIKDGTRGGGEEWRTKRTEDPFRMGWRTGPGAEGCCVRIGPKKEN